MAQPLKEETEENDKQYGTLHGTPLKLTKHDDRSTEKMMTKFLQENSAKYNKQMKKYILTDYQGLDFQITISDAYKSVLFELIPMTREKEAGYLKAIAKRYNIESEENIPKNPPKAKLMYTLSHDEEHGYKGKLDQVTAGFYYPYVDTENEEKDKETKMQFVSGKILMNAFTNLLKATYPYSLEGIDQAGAPC